MRQFRYPVPQVEPPMPPRSPRETLPTMYDLPSENPEEPGLPDEYHGLQPQLLSSTLRLPDYSRDEWFTGSDLNLYYDVRHPLWQKRPDWFLVLGVPRLYDGVDLRASYVLWQEGVDPFVVVELLSPSTLKEDLGPYARAAQDSEPENTALANFPPEFGGQPEAETVAPENSESDASGVGDLYLSSPARNGNPQSSSLRPKAKPPNQWHVYEQILRVPYYIVYSRHTGRLWFFKLEGGKYQPQALDPANPRIWITEIKLGLGLWQGTYDGIERQWLRWYDATGTWIPTDTEEKEQERQRAEQVEAQLQQVVRNLASQGMTDSQIEALTGLPSDIVQRWLIIDEGNI